MGRPKNTATRKLEPTLELPNKPSSLAPEESLVEWGDDLQKAVSESYVATADRVESLIMMDCGLERRPEPQGSGRLFYDVREEILYIDRIVCGTEKIDWYPINKFTQIINEPIDPDVGIVASFTYVTDSLEVTFTDTTIAEVVEWKWDYGDGTQKFGTDQNPVHEYFFAGTYTVLLTVTDANGNSGSATADITVTDGGGGGGGTEPDIKADFSWQNVGSDQIQFTDGSTGTIDTYIWTLGDGTTLGHPVATGPASPLHTYPGPGTYTVTLQVYGTGGSSTKTKVITVNDDGGGGGTDPPPPPPTEVGAVYVVDNGAFSNGAFDVNVRPIKFSEEIVDDGNHFNLPSDIFANPATTEAAKIYFTGDGTRYEVELSFTFKGVPSGETPIIRVFINGVQDSEIYGTPNAGDAQTACTVYYYKAKSGKINNDRVYQFYPDYTNSGVSAYFIQLAASAKFVPVSVVSGSVTARDIVLDLSGYSSSSVDHSALRNLLNDDHPQYLIGNRSNWFDLVGGPTFETDLHTHSVSSIMGVATVVDQVYYEVAEDDWHILVVIEDDAQIVLPDATAFNERVVNIKRTSANQYDVTVSVDGGGLIEGGATYLLGHKYDAIKCVAINDEWWIY